MIDASIWSSDEPACQFLGHTMWVWGRRYMRVGACIGLILAYPMAMTIPGLLINLII